MRVSLVKKLFKEAVPRGAIFNNKKEYRMVDKAIAWAKANRSLALIGVIVVLGVLSNLLGFT